MASEACQSHIRIIANEACQSHIRVIANEVWQSHKKDAFLSYGIATSLYSSQ